VVVQQVKSSVSHIRKQGRARDDGGAQGQEASVHADGAVGFQPTRAEHRSGSGSLLHVDRLRTETPATSSTLAERATQK
jgi:hypothetical protein